MVFSAFPIYTDPPNWNQQTMDPPPNTQLPSLMAESAALTATSRPVSMAERARVAKIPQPEPALKCPRCDSTNTKFCYFNNYSLTQPRHFCKTCRRYWTRGGALRNVPVGGGCRRNKRSKAGPAASKSFTAGASSSTASGSLSSANILPPPPLPPFMTSFQPLSEYSAANIGLNFAGIHSMDSVDYQVGGGVVGLEQWRMQQYPFMGGLDVSTPAQPATVAGLFPYDGDSDGYSVGRMLNKATSSGLISQMASVKMEDSSHGLTMQRQYLGVSGNDQYWDGNGGANVGNGGSVGGGWLGDLSGFN